MVINPTIKTYIFDLTHDNNCMFAQNQSILEHIKEYENELHILLQKEGNDTLKRIAYVVARVRCCWTVYKDNNKRIAENLKKVEGLRNGTITEI